LRKEILFLITILLLLPFPVSSYPEQSSEASNYFRLGIEATDWITEFQFTPLGSSFGIPFNNSMVWGLDPFVYTNGTVTGGYPEIPAGERQTLGYQIGGHDSGEAAYATLEAYLFTGDPVYLDKFNIYLDYFKRSQLPSRYVDTNSISENSSNMTLDNSGYFAEQVNADAGQDGVFGTTDDDIRLVAAFPAAEHGNPIAYALMLYYKITNDPETLDMLEKYGDWLVRSQIKEGNYTGAFPVTQYYYHVKGWQPRMFETTQSAWILAEIYSLSKDQKYLEAAERTAKYMQERQYTDNNTWNDTLIVGALPYEWKASEEKPQEYNPNVLTNHAGYALMAWLRLYEITEKEEYLTSARNYADWLLSMQVTSENYPWGDHTFANDTNAIGGYYYSYNPQNHTHGKGTFQSLWSASFGAKGLLLAYQMTGNERYLYSAKMAFQWLANMRYDDQKDIPLQALGEIKHIRSSYWGPYSQAYQPNMTLVEEAGIPEFVQRGLANKESIRSTNSTWYEKTFGVDFNIINFEMAARGERYMKMIWSWWPNIGFEPRYGGDVATGFFAMAWYLKAVEDLEMADVALEDLEEDVANSYLADEHEKILESIRIKTENAHQEFQSGWYSIASSMSKSSVEKIESAIERINLESEKAQIEDTMMQIQRDMQLMQKQVEELQNNMTIINTRLDKIEGEIETLEELITTVRSNLNTEELASTLQITITIVGVAAALLLIYLTRRK
jgi:rhamnogalacturonyl hydrolase YesR